MAKPSTKRGRPRALNLSPAAVHHLLAENRASGTEPRTKSALCDLAGISPSQLGDALGGRHRGLSEPAVRRLASALGCEPELIAPELTGRFVGLRPDDDPTELAAL